MSRALGRWDLRNSPRAQVGLVTSLGNEIQVCVLMDGQSQGGARAPIPDGGVHVDLENLKRPKEVFIWHHSNGPFLPYLPFL